MQQKYSVPASQGWSVCEFCGLDIGGEQFEVYKKSTKKGDASENASTADFMHLSWSLWGEFFHSFQNDKLKGRIKYIPSDLPGFLVHEDSNVFFVSRPVFVLPMITLHVGHVLVDLLEQVLYCFLCTEGILNNVWASFLFFSLRLPGVLRNDANLRGDTQRFSDTYRRGWLR